MILILTNQAVFVTLSVVTIPPLAEGIFILTLNQADVIGDQSDEVTQNAWFRCALCAAMSGEIPNINTNQGRVLGKVSSTKNLPLGEYKVPENISTLVHLKFFFFK